MIERLSRTKRNIALFVLGALVAWFAWSIRSVLNPVLLGYLCAFILTPFVRWFEARGYSRRTAVNLTFVTGFVLATLVGLVLAVQVYLVAREVASTVKHKDAPAVAAAGNEEGSSSTQDGETQDGETQDGEKQDGEAVGADESLEDRVQQKVDTFLSRVEEWGLPVPDEKVRVSFADLRQQALDLLRSESETTKAVGLRAIGSVTAFLQKLAGLAGMFLLLPLYAYYFLFVGKDVEQFLQRYLPKKERGRITRVTSQIGGIVASFFRGRLGVCFVKGLILSVGLLLADIPFAFLLGMLSGFLSIIPFFGPFLGFVLAFASGVIFRGGDVDHGVLSALIRTGVVFLLGETIEGYVLVPKILGDSLGLHPLVVFVALLAGGKALGMLGVIVALPLTAAIVILFKEFVLPALRDWADEDDAEDTPSSA